jgi:hypothetical protein
VDTSALPLAQEQAFLRSVHVAPGAVPDQQLMQTITQALRDLHLTPTPRPNLVPDRAQHTVKIVIRP